MEKNLIGDDKGGMQKRIDSDIHSSEEGKDAIVAARGPILLDFGGVSQFSIRIATNLDINNNSCVVEDENDVWFDERRSMRDLGLNKNLDSTPLSNFRDMLHDPIVPADPSAMSIRTALDNVL